MDFLGFLENADEVSRHSKGTQTSFEINEDEDFLNVLMSPPTFMNDSEEDVFRGSDVRVSRGTSVLFVPEVEAIMKLSMGRPRVGSTVGKVGVPRPPSQEVGKDKSTEPIELQQFEFTPTDFETTGLGLRGVATSGLDEDKKHYVGIGWINVGSMGDAEADRIPPMVRGPVSDEDRRKAVDARAGRSSQIVSDILYSAMKGAVLDAEDPTRAVGNILQSVINQTGTPGIDVVDEAIYSAIKAAVETPATLVGEALHSIVSSAGEPRRAAEEALGKAVDAAVDDSRRMAGDLLDKVLDSTTSDSRQMASDVLQSALAKTMGVNKDIARSALKEAIAKAQKYPQEVAADVLKVALSNAFGVAPDVANDALQAALIAALTAPHPESPLEVEASLMSLAGHHVPAVEMLSGDFAIPALRICPADVPKGSRPQYDLDALTKHQQRRLNQLKRATVREDQRYLSQHPEIRGVCALLLTALLHEQPVAVRDFCARWVERPTLREEVDAYLGRFRPPSRHDDPKELRDWFPVPEKPSAGEVEEERWHESPEAATLRQRERALLQAARARLFPHSFYASDTHAQAREWVDEIVSRTLGAPSITWDTFEEDFQALLKKRKRIRRKRSKLKTKVKSIPLEKEDELQLEEEYGEMSSETESEEMGDDLKEAKKAVEQALRDLEEQTFELEAIHMIQQDVELAGEGGPELPLAMDDMERMEKTRRVTAVAEALHRLRKISRSRPEYDAILQNVIGRLQEHQENELKRMAKRLPERALQWTAILQGGRASVFAQDLEMEDQQKAMTAALGFSTADRSVGEGGVHAGEQVVSMPGAMEAGRPHKKKVKSKADNERYTLRLSIAFPELAGMLHEGEKKPGAEGVGAADDRGSAKDKRSRGRSLRVRRVGGGVPSLGGSKGKKGAAEKRARPPPPPPPQKRLTAAVIFEGKDPKGKEADWRKQGEGVPKISIVDFLSRKTRSQRFSLTAEAARASRASRVSRASGVSVKELAADLQEKVEKFPVGGIIDEVVEAAVDPTSRVSRASKGSKVSRASRADEPRMTSATEEIAANAVKAVTEDRTPSIVKEIIHDTLKDVDARRERISKTTK